LLAVKAAIEEALEHRNLAINSDSKYVINGLTTNIQELEDTGFIGVSNKRLFQTTIARLRERRTETYFTWVKGHSGNEGNERADELAGIGARTEAQDEIDMEIPHELSLTGAKLNKITQALAYRAIRERKMDRQTKTFRKQIERRDTIRNLDRTRYAAQELRNGKLPTDRKIWKSTRHRDLTRQTRYFMWMIMHDAYKVGVYWTKMKDPEMQLRGYCKHCHGQVEDMEHILTKCRAPGQREVWDLAKTTWNKKKASRWNKPNFGKIMASAMTELQSSRGKKKPGASRLYRILISEAAYLIWKLRNERIIPEEGTGRAKPPATDAEIENRFYSALNIRLNLDCALTNKAKYGRHAIRKETVLSTWDGILHENNNLPEDWTRENGVLVGKE
ncbi:hypothetical protein C8J56DRAFT_722270, partial [Mycena floridula]